VESAAERVERELGPIDVWVNGIKWDMKAHLPTGCMSQYKVSPKSGNSPLTVGTMARDYWFQGGIGKVAVYNRLLSSAEISRHYSTMTGVRTTRDLGYFA